MLRAVALPGLGLDARAWAPTLDRLPRPATVVSLPGYGEPAPGGVDLAPEVLAGRVADVFDGAGPSVAGELHAPGSTGPRAQGVVLLGHSASCQVAAHVARLRPEAVSALVLVGPTTDPRRATWPRMVADWLRTARSEDPRQVPTLVKQYRRTTLRTMRRAMEAARHDVLVETCRGLRVPVLVLRGRHDVICRADWGAGVAKAGSLGSAAVTLPSGGHMVPLTDGALVAAAVEEWLRRTQSSTR